MDHLKARLVAQGHTQFFCLDYNDTFSPVASMASVHLFIAIPRLTMTSLPIGCQKCFS